MFIREVHPAPERQLWRAARLRHHPVRLGLCCRREGESAVSPEVWTGVGDADFVSPYVDVDEWRDDPVRHRYVHGGFTSTETRFSVYFPPAELYEGRFFQHVTPVPDSENLAQSVRGEQDKISFSTASGAYFVETNAGGVSGTPGSGVDPTIAAYRANGAAAQYSRVLAAEMYGEHRPYGYLYGGSGGSYRTIGAAENTSGVWDGFVPYVIGSPMSIPNMFTVRMHAQRILRDQLDRIVDAVEPGGSGDMFDGLDAEENAALVEVTRMGFPPRSWFGHRTMGMHAFPVLYNGLRRADPSYFDEFWSEAGYLGHAAPRSLLRDVVEHRCEIVAVLAANEAAALGITMGRQPGQARGGVDTAWRDAGESVPVPVALRLSPAAPVDALGADLLVHSGAASGERLGLLRVQGNLAVLGPGDPTVISSVRAGDAVEIDNRGYLAAQTYHRHQVPSQDFYVWDQFRNADGSPIYPQRPMLLGPLFAAAAAGTVQTGAFQGKMIVVESLLDREALPWQADWYCARVREHLGAELDEHLRVWFVDNALHGDDEVQEDPTHTISYVGVLHQALRDVSAWVEQGIAPPTSTAYEIADGQVIVPTRASARHGVQPAVSLTVNGQARADVSVGDTITLRATAEAPSGGGSIVALEWDLDGTGLFATRDQVTPEPRAVVERQHTVTTPGTSFLTVRVVANRNADADSPYARIQNLARSRVVAS
jgi:hypothetical protein